MSRGAILDASTAVGGFWGRQRGGFLRAKLIVGAALVGVLLGCVSSRAEARALDGCRPLRAIFYAATGSLALAQGLAANASACAQYYVTVPPLAADKTQMRSGVAGQIRALGLHFHALAEVNVSAWQGFPVRVPNAIVDDDLGAWLRAITAKRAYVWAIFDCCHSGTMTRGTEMVREVPPEILVPRDELDKARRRAAQRQESTRGGPTQGEQRCRRKLVSPSILR